MKKKIPQSPSPLAKKVLTLFQQYQSLDQIKANHPEITDKQIAMVTLELAAFMPTPTVQVTRKAGAQRKKKVPFSGMAYQIKITLRGSKPPIWRRVLVPVEIRLDILHEVIQLAMGWGNGHLHCFNVNDCLYDGAAPDGSMLDDSMGEPEADVLLCELIAGEKAKFHYTYDFGDNWEHKLLVEKIIPANQNPKLFACTGGAGACPLEDSGGIWGYYEMLKILNDPKDPQYASFMEWCGGMIYPHKLDLAEINKRLCQLR